MTVRHCCSLVNLQGKTVHPKFHVYKNTDYEAFVRKLPCLVCRQYGVDGHHVDHSRKNSFQLVPLCRLHHTFGKNSYHAIERRRFEEEHKINLDWEIINLLSRYIDERRK